MSATNEGNPPNGGTKTIAVPQAPERGQVVRTGFGTAEVERAPETASAALAMQARAAVEARFVMALQRPRDMERVRVNILAACIRPFFAELAVYSKPVGKKKNDETGEWEQQYAEGLSIRFAEEAIRNLGNAMTESTTLYDDGQKRILRVSATDFENNVIHFKDITADKTVERRQLKPGQRPLGQRFNSYGDLVHIVEATEDEFATKIGALGSKALRDKILMLIPSDIQEEAKAICWRTNADKDAKDPEAARRAIIDSFAKVGVAPDQLAELIGHEMSTILPAELQKLRAIYSAINDGEATWGDVIGQKRDFEKEKADKDKAKAAGAGAPKGKADLNDLGAAAKAKREGAAPAAGAKDEKPKPAAATTRLGVPTTKKAEPEEEDKGDVPGWMGEKPTDDGTGIT
jgi:hypothetical protein